MAAAIEEPTGKAAGRVTIVATAVSLIPPFATIGVVVGVFLVGIISAEIAGAVILGVLVNAGLTTGSVFTAAKKTPTDQARTVYSSGPTGQVVPEVSASPVVEVSAADAAVVADLEAQLAQVTPSVPKHAA